MQIQTTLLVFAFLAAAQASRAETSVNCSETKTTGDAVHQISIARLTVADASTVRVDVHGYNMTQLGVPELVRDGANQLSEVSSIYRSSKGTQTEYQFDNLQSCDRAGVTLNLYSIDNQGNTHLLRKVGCTCSRS